MNTVAELRKANRSFEGRAFILSQDSHIPWNPRYPDPVANLTLAIDDRLLEEARRLALEQGTSVNQLVREYLETLVAMNSRKEEAKQWLLKARFDYNAGDFDRDALYGR